MTQKPVPITGVHLNAYSERIRVSVEINGKWIEVINEYWTGEGHASHIVEAAGIKANYLANFANSLYWPLAQHKNGDKT